jgi:hypothetical protein
MPDSNYTLNLYQKSNENNNPDKVPGLSTNGRFTLQIIEGDNMDVIVEVEWELTNGNEFSNIEKHTSQLYELSDKEARHLAQVGRHIIGHPPSKDTCEQLLGAVL